MPPVERIITHHSCTTVSRPAADVSRYVLDPTTMPHWSAVIYEVDPPTAGVFEKGGRLRGRMHILGLSLAVEGEMVEFDPAGKVVQAWGGSDGYQWPAREHGISVDPQGNVWVTFTGPLDHIVTKFTRSGKFLLDLGRRGQTRAGRITTAWRGRSRRGSGRSLRG